ncbi:hypothetical protein ACF0H5_016682 [Mactra antiquata]
MAFNTSKTADNTSNSDFEGFSLLLPVNLDSYVDKHCEINFSEASHNITIKILCETFFLKLMEFFNHLYTMEDNKPKTGLTTCTELGGLKVVLTLYRTKTLLVQGSGCRLWTNSIFNHLLKELGTTSGRSDELRNDCSSQSLTSQSPQASSQTDVKQTECREQDKNKSIKTKTHKFFFKTLRKKSPKSSTPINSQYYSKRCQKMLDTQHPSAEKTDNLPDMSTTKTQDMSEANKLSSSQSPDNISSIPLSQTMKQMSDIINSSEHSTIFLELNEAKNNNSILEDDNQKLQNKLKQAEDKIKTISDQLQKALKAKSEIKKPNNSSTQNMNENESQANRNKIADLTAQVLILEEENSKLKLANKQLTKDNKNNQKRIRELSEKTENTTDTLLTNILEQVSSIKSNTTMINERIEQTPSLEKIKHSLNEVAKNIVQNINTCTFKELNQQKQAHTESILPDSCNRQKENSITNIMTPTQSPVDQNSTLSDDEKMTDSTSSSNQNSNVHICIIGDSVTKVLDPRRLTGERYSVNIKSTSGAKISTVKNLIHSQSIKNLNTCDAIILHVGTNDILANKTEKITDHYSELISIIKSTNKNAKIILSSILPRDSSNAATQQITEVNAFLANLSASDDKVYFINNNNKFSHNGNINKDLFNDTLHLSRLGAAHFAKNIMASINNVLNVGYNRNTTFRSMKKPLPSPWRRQYPNNTAIGNFQQHRLHRPMQRMIPPPWFMMYRPTPVM